METIDKSNMRQVIIDSASQLKEGLNLAEKVKVDGDFKNVVVCGIGGSALPVNVLDAIADSNIPIFAHRDYDLPKQASADSLIICISYSGNTEETLSALEKAISKNLKIVGIASGGKVEEICNKNSIPFVKIPAGIQPRCATGYIVSAVAKVLSNSGVIKDLSEYFIEASNKLSEVNEQLEKDGENLAKKLLDKMPIVYSSNKFKTIARIWKIKFNENSKTPAFYNYFPELNHNEMVGFSNLKESHNFHFIIIKDKEDNPRNLKRMDLFADLLNKRRAKIDFVNIKEGSMVFQVFSALLLGDWTSYYLALEYKVDPTPVEMVEEFKKLMAE